MPSKALLRPPEALAAARLVPGAAEAVTGDDRRRARVLAPRSGHGRRGRLEPGRVAGRPRRRARARPGADRRAGRGRGGRAHDRVRAAPDRDRVGAVDPAHPRPGRASSTGRTARRRRPTRCPARLIVIGAGPVGCELAQVFSRMGSQVTIVDVAERLLPRDHPDAGRAARRRARRRGRRRCGWARRIERVEPGVRMHLGDGEHDRGRPAAGRDRAAAERGRPRASRRSASRSPSAASRWTSGCGRPRACGRPATSPGSRCSRTSASTRRGWRRRRWRAAPCGPTTGPCPAVTFTDPQVAVGRRHLGRGHGHGRARIGRPALDLRAAEAARVPEGVRRPGAAGARRRGGGRPRGGRVARAS